MAAYCKWSKPRKIVTGIMICFLILGFAEILLRCSGIDLRLQSVRFGNRFDPENRFLALSLSRSDKVAETVAFNLVDNPIMQADPETIFRVRSGDVTTRISHYTGINAEGFRGPEFSNDFQGGKILIVGDSCAFGWKIPDWSSTLCALLQEKLSTPSKTWRTVNLGQPGFSSTQGLVLFRKWYPRIRPDILLLYFGWNDILLTPLFTDSQMIRYIRFSNSPPVGWVKELRLYGLLFKILEWAGAFPQQINPREQKRYEPSGSDKWGSRVPIEETISNYEEMIREVPTIVILPPVGNIPPGVKAVMEAFKNALEKAFADRAVLVRFTDMETQEGEKWFCDDQYHPNEQGAQHMVETLVPLIQRMASGALRTGIFQKGSN